MARIKWTPPAAGDIFADNRVEDLQKVEAYLTRFGYLDEDETKTLSSHHAVPVALKALQAEARLPETGILDARTVATMSQPHCGTVDPRPSSGGNRIGLTASYMGTVWYKFNLTYSFPTDPGKWCNDLSREEIRGAIRAAYDRWAASTPFTFREDRNGTGDTTIQWVSGTHAPAPHSVFDGVGNVLAHASWPGPGNYICFDQDERYTPDMLYRVALHEIGHTLGLRHSEDYDAVMYRTSHGQWELQPDDIRGIHSLYGPKPGSNGWNVQEIWADGSLGQESPLDFATASPAPFELEIFSLARYGTSGWVARERASSGYRLETRQQMPLAPGRFDGLLLSSLTAFSKGKWTGVFYNCQGYIQYMVRGNPQADELYDWGLYDGGWDHRNAAIAHESKIAVVSSKPDVLDIFYINPPGEIGYAMASATAINGMMGPTFKTITSPQTAAVGGSIAAVSHTPGNIEVFWIAPNGSVRNANWWPGANYWNFGEIAPAGSASLQSEIAAVSRFAGHWEIFYQGPDQSIKHAYWYQGESHQNDVLLPAEQTLKGGLAAFGGIAAVSRHPNYMQVWWTSTAGSVETEIWADGSGWRRETLTAPDIAKPGTKITVVVREADSMDVFFTGTNGSLKNLNWYAGSG